MHHRNAVFHGVFRSGKFNFFALDFYAARIFFINSEQAFHQRGFSRAVFSHQRVNRSFFHGKTSVVQRFHPRKRFAYIRHFQQNILFVIRHFLHLFISYGSFPAKFLRSPENFRKENRSVGRLFTPELRANKGFSIFSRCSRIYNPCRRGKLFRLSDSSRSSRSRLPSRRRPASPYLPSYRF